MVIHYYHADNLADRGEIQYATRFTDRICFDVLVRIVYRISVRYVIRQVPRFDTPQMGIDVSCNVSWCWVVVLLQYRPYLDDTAWVFDHNGWDNLIRAGNRKGVELSPSVREPVLSSTKVSDAMFTGDNLTDIIQVIVAGMFGGGLVFLATYLKNKWDHKLNIVTEKDNHEIESGGLLIKLVEQQQGRIDQLTTRVIQLEQDADKQREAARMKDARIAELESITQKQEDEISDLRKQIADKNETIKRLSARLEALENKRGGQVKPC